MNSNNIGDYDLNINRLTKTQSNSLEGEIRISELLYALKNMNNNKTPGPDGFSVEFYKFSGGIFLPSCCVQK